MHNRTITKNGYAVLGRLEFEGLLKKLLRVYRFNNDNETPKALVVPEIKSVEGVKVKLRLSKEEKDAIIGGESQ